MTRKRDIKQFRAACREVGLSPQERYEASEALHSEKQLLGDRGHHLSHTELMVWLQQWRQR